MHISKIRNDLDLTCHECGCKATSMISNDVGITNFYCDKCLKNNDGNSNLYIRTIQDLQLVGSTLDSFIEWKRLEILDFLDSIGVSVETFEYDLRIAELEFNIGYHRSLIGKNSLQDKFLKEIVLENSSILNKIWSGYNGTKEG